MKFVKLECKTKQEYTVLDTIRPFWDSQNDYLVIRTKLNIFCCQKERWEKYVLGCTEEHWRKVDNWISDYVMPYATRKTVNYDTVNSYGLKDRCERELGEYVSEELIMALISSKGVWGENKSSNRLYPTSLYFALSSRFNQKMINDFITRQEVKEGLANAK